MCGIAGVLALDGGAPPELAELAAMSAALAHRGPDGAGHHLDQMAGLAFRRLALVDPVGGAQPIASEDGSVHVICNGELYDHRALRRRLERRGHTFRTGSDVEVLVHLYEERGPAFVEDLRGMFAVALWDARERRLVLARDPFGIKPLVYARLGRRLVFASELKALLALPDFPREIDPAAVEGYLAHNAVPAPATIFRAARKLEPGHRLIADRRGVRLERYGRPRPVAASELRREPVAALAEEARERLAGSVRAHLAADAPVGVLLSGGLDSSLVTALAASEGAPLQTFSVGFDVAAFDELAAARTVAERYGTEHRELRLGPEAAGELEGVAASYDEPSGDATALPYWLLARFAAGHVKAVLTGEGADELFGGYQTYAADRLGPAAARAAAALAPAVARWPSSSGRLSLDFRLRRLALGAGLDPLERHHAFKQTFSPALRDALLGQTGDPLAALRARYAETEGAEPIARLQDVDVGSFLADDLLPQADRAGMAHGLEVRVPFLDPAVAELAYALPLDARVRGFKTKRVLRAAAAPLLPAAVAHGPKRGFCTPVAAWLRGPLEELARDLLSPERVARQGWFAPAPVTALLERHVSRRAQDLGRPLWALIAFGLWHDAWAAAPATGLPAPDPALLGGGVMPSGSAFSVSQTMRRVALAAATAALALGWAEPARAQDPEAPDGAPKYWLANEDWINYLWLPYEEARLYKLIGQTRGDVFRWVRDEHTIAELAKRRGWEPRKLAEALVAPRRGEVSAAMLRELADRAERTLTQGHLGQHILFHALHQTAVPEHAKVIFGTRNRQEFLKLRRAELSPLQICELNGRTRVEAERGVSDALRDAAARGVRDGSLPPDQAQVMLERQLRQVPRWLGQNRYNGPSGGANKPDLPEADVAKHPSISADGRTVVWDAYRADISAAERLGEIHVRAAVLGQRRFSVTPPSRSSTRRPRSAYNSVVSADGNAVAFETAESTYPLAKRVGNMTVFVRDLATGKVERVSHAHRPKGAPTRTAFNPALSADGRIVAFEATDAGRNGAPSRNGLWVVDRRAGRERLVTDASRGAAYLPDVAGDGRSVAYTSAKFSNEGLTHVYLTSLKTGRTALVSRADGRNGVPAAGDAYEPSVSVDGRFVAFTSRAANLGGDGHAEIYLRDLQRGTTRLVTGAISADAGSPSLSADGRYVAFVVRVGHPNGKRESLRSRVWRHDLQTGQDVLVSRATGARGVSADGYATDPSISVDGRRVAFATTAGNLAEAKPDGIAGVFVRDLETGTTTLLSTHARRPGTGGVGMMAVAAPTGAGLALAFGGLLLLRRRRSS